MFKRQLLSRAEAFTATHGINQSQKDYLSIIKNQGNEGLCWAYALTSTIETNYALKTGNRLMLDPIMLKNKSVPWWKDQSKKVKKAREPCLSYGENGGYNPYCAVEYMMNSHNSMIQQDGEDSFLEITDGAEASIKNLNDLYRALDNHGVLYSGIFADHLSGRVISNYQDTNKDCNHAVVITAVGHLSGYNGIFAEVLNSWGYSWGADGLIYIKIADDEEEPLVNNMNMFHTNIWVEVSRTITTEDIAIAFVIILSILLILSLIALGIFIFLYCRIHKRIIKFDGNTDPQSLNP